MKRILDQIDRVPIVTSFNLFTASLGPMKWPAILFVAFVVNGAVFDLAGSRGLPWWLWVPALSAMVLALVVFHRRRLDEAEPTWESADAILAPAQRAAPPEQAVEIEAETDDAPAEDDWSEHHLPECEGEEVALSYAPPMEAETDLDETPAQADANAMPDEHVGETEGLEEDGDSEPVDAEAFSLADVGDVEAAIQDAETEPHDDAETPHASQIVIDDADVDESIDLADIGAFEEEAFDADAEQEIEVDVATWEEGDETLEAAESESDAAGMMGAADVDVEDEINLADIGELDDDEAVDDAQESAAVAGDSFGYVLEEIPSNVAESNEVCRMLAKLHRTALELYQIDPPDETQGNPTAAEEWFGAWRDVYGTWSTEARAKIAAELGESEAFRLTTAGSSPTPDRRPIHTDHAMKLGRLRRSLTVLDQMVREQAHSID